MFSLDKRTTSLFFAVLHHGLSNIAENTVPTSWARVIETAKHFRKYLEGEKD